MDICDEAPLSVGNLAYMASSYSMRLPVKMGPLSLGLFSPWIMSLVMSFGGGTLPFGELIGLGFGFLICKVAVAFLCLVSTAVY